jgi:hypothetical protein
MNMTITGGKLKFIPRFPKTYSFAFEDLVKGTVQISGKTQGSDSALSKNITSILTHTPCRITITAPEYTYNDVTYAPYFRVACNGAFIVGGFNNKDTPQCNNILIPEGATGVGFHVTWQAEGHINISSSSGTNNPDILNELYETGDITLLVESA